MKDGYKAKRGGANAASHASAGETGAKLSKQERRNLNKKLKAQNVPATAANQPPSGEYPKESVYKRDTVYPPAIPESDGPWDRFVTPEDPNLQAILNECFQGFVVSPPDKFTPGFHEAFTAALEGLDAEGCYQYDITQPAGLGTKTAKTFVTRCLVGDAGTTYKYLGLRMFSIPWNESESSSPHAVAVGRLNDEMISHTAELLKLSKKPKVGACNYNLTLINRCFPAEQCVLKNEPSFEKDKCSVSWHADSTLEHFSTIAVYHITSATAAHSTSIGPSSAKAQAGATHPTATGGDEAGGAAEDMQTEARKGAAAAEEDMSWRVALRVWYDAEGPNATKAISSRAAEMQTGARVAPSVAVPLPSGSSYFLLDDFNHHHQHAVLAGNTYRYASTHRVCKTEGHTFQSVRAKVDKLMQVTGKLQYSSKNIRLEQLAMNELEFEWIRQFSIQGKRHRELHPWWHQPMKELLKQWEQLEERTIAALETLKAASTFDHSKKFDRNPDQEVDPAVRKERKQWVKLLQRVECVDAASFDVMAEALRDRHEKRAGWAAREKDPMFATVPFNCRPLPCPIADKLLATPAPGTLPRVTSLLNLAQCVDQWKKAFLANKK